MLKGSLNGRVLKSLFSTDKVKFYFELKDGSLQAVTAKLNQNLLEIAHENNIEVEGACDAQLACSTCHLILEDKLFDDITPPSMVEEDLLDLAPSLTPTSRLGCQVKITEQFKNTVVKLPKITRNFYVDGFIPKPH